MGYALEHHVAVEDDVRRIMSEQLKKALKALGTVDDEPAEAIYSARKRCKKIRGVARLVRPAMSGERYSKINELARDAGRELAPYRDATAMAETFDRVMELALASSVASDTRRSVRTALTDRGRALESEAAVENAAVTRARKLLTELDDAIDGVELGDSGFDAIGSGVAKTYRRGRDALDVAGDAPTGANFHEWRKRAKYTRYHLDLLTPSAPSIVAPMERGFHDLTDALGDAHDLVVLGEWFRSGPDEHLGDTTDLLVVIDGIRVELEHRAIALGRRLYAEPPKQFRKRLGAYWDVWSAEESRSPAGDLEQVLG